MVFLQEVAIVVTCRVQDSVHPDEVRAVLRRAAEADFGADFVLADYCLFIAPEDNVSRPFAWKGMGTYE